MSRIEDRRGDRRKRAWWCRGNPDTGVTCVGVGNDRMELEHDGTVYCRRCGAIDRRSTEGNRRRAQAELAQLERRVESELHHLGERVEALEGVVVPGLHVRRQLEDPVRPEGGGQ